MTPQKIALFLSGALATAENDAEAVVKIGIADVTKVFDTARSAIAASPLSTNLKTDLTAAANDAQTDVAGLAGIAGTELGALVSEGVTSATELFAWLTNAVAPGKTAATLSAAEKAAVVQGATAITAQISTLTTQFQVGVMPATAAPVQQQDEQKAA
jgi:hypothetical protein